MVIKVGAIGEIEVMERQMIIAEMADEANIPMEATAIIQIIANLLIVKADAAIILIQVILIIQTLRQLLGLILIALPLPLLKLQ
jgi:hypothetical protein